MTLYPHQQTHYCQVADGVNIAYATVGTGPPLVKAANWLTHLEFDWEVPLGRGWIEELAKQHTLFRYDERGCGLSDWQVADLTFEAWVSDLEAVVDAAGLDCFPLLGISQGGAVAMAYAQRHPERVSHLILYGAYARGRFVRDPSAKMHDQEMALLKLVKLGWGQQNPAFRQLFTAQFMPEGSPRDHQWFNELQRVSTSPDNAARFLSEFARIDVQDIAASLDIPTLVAHAQDDGRVPFDEGRLIAALLPNAQFYQVNSKNHLLLPGETAWRPFFDQVQRFLTEPASTGSRGT